MTNLKYFLNIIKSLDESIKNNIKSMVNSEFIIHMDKTSNPSDEVNGLLKNIEGKIPKTFGSSIPYIISELTDNIEQHSDYSNAYIFLNKNARENIVEILIFDDGLTIPFVFEKNKIKFFKDSEAVKMALEGTTTKKEDISRGFGLSTSKEIVNALKGSIKIISRKGFLELQDSIINIHDIEEELKGTLILLKLKTPEKDLNIYKYLE